MKKFLSLIFVLSFLVFIGNSERLLAGETDSLIKKLIDKGIITEQEAKEIQKEEQKAEEQRQEKVVKEIQDKELAVPKSLKGLEFEMLAYFDYSYGDKPAANNRETSLNDFSITRGYLTLKKEILPWLSARTTLDTTQTTTGDWEVRLKYLYAEFRPPNMGPLTGMKSEAGLGHIPWLDFEESVNPYRCQGTMAIERAGVFNSADLGVSLRGDFGGKLENAEERTGNKSYDGKYGGWHLGVYNGAGYHNSETNKNKIVDGRLTVRPLPDIVPGLQLSYFGLYGEGNGKTPVGNWPDYEVNMGMLSYQNPWVTFTGQYFTTKGNAQGTWFDAKGDALDTKGYSVFGDVKLPVLEKKLSAFARYDYFDQDKDAKIGSDADYSMYIGGLAYNIYKGNLIMLTYETTDYGQDAGQKGKIPVQDDKLGDDWRVQTVLQLKY